MRALCAHTAGLVRRFAGVVLVLLLAASGCAEHDTPVLITLSGEVSGLTSIEVAWSLNGQARGRFAMNPAAPQYVLWLAPQERGSLHLDAAVMSSEPGGCVRNHAQAEVQVEATYLAPVPVTLDLKQSDPPLCLVTVAAAQVGEVASVPTGLSCQGDQGCSGWFPRGTMLTLSTSSGSASRHALWSGACNMKGPSCSLKIESKAAVRVVDERGLCTKDNWCWKSGRPQGNSLFGVWGKDASNVWAVGEQGTILKWNETAWSLQDSGTQNSLSAVWGTSVDDVWAVGDNGTIVHWDGLGWTAARSGTPLSLFGIWGTDARNVWAVGEEGTILKWNGSAWSALTTPSQSTLYGIWGTSAVDIWAVGEDSEILHWDGAQWASQDSNIVGYQTLYAIWGTDTKNVRAVGNAGTIVHWNGKDWSTREIVTDADLYSVAGLSSTHVLVAGFTHRTEGTPIPTGRLVTWNGTVWDTEAAVGTALPLSVWALDEKTAWAVGYDGLILKWDGMSWAQQSKAGDLGFAALSGVWAAGPTKLWGVGEEGTIAMWDGMAWHRQTSGTQSFLSSVWGADPDNIWAVGEGGEIRKWNGTSWSPQASPTTENLSAIWGMDSKNVWAVATEGTIIKWDGTAWVPQASGTTAQLSSVWGIDADNVWAVGSQGTILRLKEGAWEQVMDVNTTEFLTRVWGTDADNVWIVGSNGTLFAWNGSYLEKIASGTNALLYGVWGTDASNIWMLGTPYGGTSVAPSRIRGRRSDRPDETFRLPGHGSGGAMLGVNRLQQTLNPWGCFHHTSAIFPNTYRCTDLVRGFKWDGAAWTSPIGPTLAKAVAIWGSDANHVTAIGAFGAILQYEP